MSEESSLAIRALVIPSKPAKDDYTHHASQAEAAISQLHDGDNTPSPSVLLQLTAYTDPCDLWTTPSASLTARAILSSLPPDATADFIVDTVLQRHLRPIFSKATEKVTPSGRPSHYPGQDALVGAAAEEEPAWKREGLGVVATFAWAVQTSNSDLINANWPLFTPVLLTLLEDRYTPVRRKGLETLTVFLEKCPPRILSSTGIGTVFQDAVFPTLLYLPALTPEEESVTLLRPAYAALLALARSEKDTRAVSRRKQLDKMLRDGVFAAYHHSSEHIRIVEVLMDVTVDIVAALGVFSAKHLQSIMGMISSIMTDPFATAHGPALLAASKALNSCVRECWPRVAETERIGDVLRMTTTCWLNIHSDTTGLKAPKALVADIETELKLTSKMLQAIRHDRGIELPSELSEIIQREPRLRVLFPSADSPSS